MPDTTTAIEAIEPLVAGDNLTWEEFERRWDATPDLKRAELIGGIVYMAPLSTEHGDFDGLMAGLLFSYRRQTPGCAYGIGTTWRMFGDAPQPDTHLRILPKYGGQSRTMGKYCSGAPELAAEICHSSAAYDLHQKKDLYHRAGVKEYVAVLLHERKVKWFIWKEDGYGTLDADKKGIVRSHVFPGMWLNVPALFDEDSDAFFETMDAGLNSKEHAEFVVKLAKAKKR